MNFKTLDNLLLELTESEKRYLHGDYFNYGKSMEKVLHNEEKILQFSLKNIANAEKGAPFFIRKQSRFAPVPRHITDVVELNYIYKGRSEQYVNGKQIVLEQGDLIIIDTSSSHEVISSGYHDIVISINISQDFFKKNFSSYLSHQYVLSQFIFQAISDSQNHNQYLLFRSQNSDSLHLLFQQLLCEVYEPSILDESVKNLYLQLILLELIRSFNVEGNGTGSDSRKQQLMLDILSYIEKNYATATLQKCANHFGYNTSYFSSLVKQSTGQSFKYLLQSKRIEASLPLLLYSKESIREIALDVGFTNLNHYYDLFKSKYHMTPAEYRNLKK
ncbi:AraC family transcriptional regulator [Streptococcus dentiloxodontae]